MKQTFLILIFLILAGCAHDRIAKPDALMSSEQMINFHIDLALLNASTNYAKDNFISMDSLYAFHNIDSTAFAQSNVYYASKPKLYIKIFESVKAELKNLQKTGHFTAIGSINAPRIIVVFAFGFLCRGLYL